MPGEDPRDNILFLFLIKIDLIDQSQIDDIQINFLDPLHDLSPLNQWHTAQFLILTIYF